MDAARLVAEAERVVRGAPQPEQIVAEAWQAYELARALGRFVGAAEPRAGVESGGGAGGGTGESAAAREDREGREGAARREGAPDPERERERKPEPDLEAEWASAGRSVARAGPAPVAAGTGAGPPRAARLTGVRDPAGTVRALRVLLGEIGLALVDAACAAGDETAYWLCIEALDAVDEAKERAGRLARAIEGEAEGEAEGAADGEGDAMAGP